MSAAYLIHADAHGRRVTVNEDGALTFPTKAAATSAAAAARVGTAWPNAARVLVGSRPVWVVVTDAELIAADSGHVVGSVNSYLAREHSQAHLTKEQREKLAASLRFRRTTAPRTRLMICSCCGELAIRETDRDAETGWCTHAAGHVRFEVFEP